MKKPPRILLASSRLYSRRRSSGSSSSSSSSALFFFLASIFVHVLLFALFFLSAGAILLLASIGSVHCLSASTAGDCSGNNNGNANGNDISINKKHDENGRGEWFLSRRRWLASAAAAGGAGVGSTNLFDPSSQSSSAAAAAGGEVSTISTYKNKKKQQPYLTDEYYNNMPVTRPDAGRTYFPTLTPPFFDRATFRYDLGRGMYAFEQLLTFANVSATIRSNVVELGYPGSRRLWVHSPLWPTGEYCSLLDEIGHVEHVVLPCNALEHKAPMKAFTSKYPNAQVWIAPGQYGPFGTTCGVVGDSNTKGATKRAKVDMGYRVDGIFSIDVGSTATSNLQQQLPPWADEFDMATLYIDIPKNAGPVSEVAFCHKPTKTLIATDAVVYIPSSPPPPPSSSSSSARRSGRDGRKGGTDSGNIFATYFDQETVEEPSFWPKTVLQAVFLPLRTETGSINSVADKSDSDIYYPGFEAIKERLIRAPILRAFADARAPDEVKAWTEAISKFDFDRIVTSHFASPIKASPADFAAAYGYLSPSSSSSSSSYSALPPIACQDWELLEGLNRVIADYDLGAPAVFDYRQDCR